MSRSHPTFADLTSAGPELVEKNFFRHVMLPNGTFKTTDRQRLNDLNAFTLPFIKGLSHRPLRIMDVAASSGSTTAEWRAHLEQAGVAHYMTATDKSPSAFLVSLVPGISALVDKDRNPLHFDVFGAGMSPRIARTPLAPVKVALRTLLKLTCRSLQNAQRLPLTFSSTMPVEEDDLLAPNPASWIGAFDVVRAANILHRGYFGDSDLSVMISNLKARLASRGLLIVSRTRDSDSSNAASIFRCDNGSLAALARLNAGSEVEGLAIH